jgi:hypothetical protein
MKKWLIIIIALIGVSFLLEYIFFPKQSNVSNTEKINCKSVTISRFLLAEDKWKKWWPGTVKHNTSINKDTFKYNGYHYTITGLKYNAVDIQTTIDDLTINSTIILVPINNDSVEVDWKYALETNSNPINRIYLYLVTKKINKNMVGIMKSMKAFFENDISVYGMKIDQITVKDTMLVSSKFTSIEYPSTSRIYSAIDSLKNYIASNNAKVSNYPMLHVLKDNGLFKTTIAIPVNIKIPESNNFSMKRMVPGKILVTEVKGGIYTADEAMRQVSMYMTENQLSSPAIPFESLITNRIEEKDTSKWITKIYYPVF